MSRVCREGTPNRETGAGNLLTSINMRPFSRNCIAAASQPWTCSRVAERRSSRLPPFRHSIIEFITASRRRLASWRSRFRRRNVLVLLSDSRVETSRYSVAYWVSVDCANSVDGIGPRFDARSLHVRVAARASCVNLAQRKLAV